MNKRKNFYHEPTRTEEKNCLKHYSEQVIIGRTSYWN